MIIIIKLQINKSNQFLLEIFKFTQIFPKLIHIMNHSVLKYFKHGYIGFPLKYTEYLRF